MRERGGGVSRTHDRPCICVLHYGHGGDIVVIVLYSAGGHHQQIHHHLCELLAGTGTGKMLSRVSEQDEENCCGLYQCYLRDYIRSVHRVMHKQSSIEYKVRCVTTV